jgi:hypothetical protein
VLPGRGLYDELITRLEETYQLWFVVLCHLENLKNKETMTRVGSQRHNKEKSVRTDNQWRWTGNAARLGQSFIFKE